jgi:hypothetical protein
VSGTKIDPSQINTEDDNMADPDRIAETYLQLHQ